MGTDRWAEVGQLVLENMKRHEEAIDALREKISKQHETIAVLKTKVWVGVGIVTTLTSVIVGILVKYLGV